MLKHARPDLLASRSRPRTTATVDPLPAGYWLLATGCWLLVTGCWLLVTGCWLLAAGYRGLEAVIRTIGCWLLAVLDHWPWTGKAPYKASFIRLFVRPLIMSCWLLVTGCWLLAAGYRGLEAGIMTIGCWLLTVDWRLAT